MSGEIPKPFAVDLFCGLGGWTEGMLAEGYDVIGFDIERHKYGDSKYPAQLVQQDVLTLHGSQFKNASLIVASPPCQEYSYMAMPWSRAKAIAAEYRSGARDVKKLTALFDACFRIQREAIEAAGRFIPLVVENVRGAEKWVGRARWNYGSFYLWGDVPALMPMTKAIKNNGGSWFNIGSPGQKVVAQNPDGRKVPGLNFSNYGKPGYKAVAFNSTAQKLLKEAKIDGIKNKDSDGYEREHHNAFGWRKPRTSSNSSSRKHASAVIAKIPLPLSRHIAAVWKPKEL